MKTFKYCPDGKIFYKLSYDDEHYVELPCRSNTNNLNNQPRCRLYDNRINITKKKFKYLQELTSVLSKEVKDFYTNLLYDPEDKKANQKTESDEDFKNKQEIVNNKETSANKKATKLKSTAVVKNKGSKKAKQQTESDESENKQEMVNSEETSAKKEATKLKSTTTIEKSPVRKGMVSSKSELNQMPYKRKQKK